jgi:beta-glucosidase
MKVTDGPIGARGNGFTRSSAACFPCGTALGATWNPDLLEEVGAALAGEVRTKGAQMLLGPTVNLHRSPLGGRNFECYSEDPWLTAVLAEGFITGLQSAGVGACIKHYVGNESEHERRSISVEIPERALRELYLFPFEHVITAGSEVARPWGVMGAYNLVAGEQACAHDRLLNQVLKEEWGYDGLVVSDWGALHDTVRSANGGCDLEMPGPPLFFGRRLSAAVAAGDVAESVIDGKVRRLLRTVWRSGQVASPRPFDETAVDRTEDHELIRRVGAESIVLLANRDVLPL